MKPTIVICLDGAFLIVEYNTYKLLNYESEEIDEHSTRVKFDVFDINPIKKLDRGINYFIENFQFKKRYYFIEEKIGFECNQTISTKYIITSDLNIEEYISCLKLEKL